MTRTARAEMLTEAEKEMKTATYQRTVSALTAWRRGTEPEGAIATRSCLSWTQACSWIGPEPSSENRP